MGNKNTKISPQVLKDLKDNTEFSGSEIKKWYKGFLKHHPSGNLSVEEFTKTYKTIFALGDPREFAEHVFRKYDTNGDGTIDFREFLCGLSATTRGNIENKLKWVFSIYDIDNDGYITKMEMLQIITATYKMVDSVLELPEHMAIPEKQIDKMFFVADKDKDGKLSLEEFIRGVKSDPSVADLLLSALQMNFLYLH